MQPECMRRYSALRRKELNCHMFYIRRPSEEEIRRLLTEAETQPFTHSPVGATRGEMPPGYKHIFLRVDVGKGQQDFEDACRGLRTFAHLGLHWVHLVPPGIIAEPGTTNGVLAQIFFIWSLNPCRVVYAEHGENAEGPFFAIAQGTLPGHAAEGEERFCVQYSEADEKVYYELRSFSVPRHILTKLGRPYLRHLQYKFARNTALALQAAVKSCRLPGAQM